MAIGLWDDLPDAVRNLLLLPDGHWTEAQRDAAAERYEQFFVLRWALVLDAQLRPLDRQPAYAGKVTVSTIRRNKPRKLALRPPWDLRAARDEAYWYFDRFWLEAVARQLVGRQFEDEVLVEAKRLKAKIDEDNSQSTDLLVGAETVSELDNETLMRMVVTSYRRWDLLKQLTSIVSGESAASELRISLFDSLAEAQPAAL